MIFRLLIFLIVIIKPIFTQKVIVPKVIQYSFLDKNCQPKHTIESYTPYKDGLIVSCAVVENYDNIQYKTFTYFYNKDFIKTKTIKDFIAFRVINDNILYGTTMYGVNSHYPELFDIETNQKIGNIKAPSSIYNVGIDKNTINAGSSRYNLNAELLWQNSSYEKLGLIMKNGNICYRRQQYPYTLYVINKNNGSSLIEKTEISNQAIILENNTFIDNEGIFDENGSKIKSISLDSDMIFSDINNNIITLKYHTNISFFNKYLESIGSYTLPSYNLIGPLVVSDSDIIYSAQVDLTNFILAINYQGRKLWRINIAKPLLLLDQKGVIHTKDFLLQTSSKGLSRGGWPMVEHDPRRTNNASSPIYLKEYPNNNNHKKVICEVDNKTIDINKLTHLSKGWHLLGNSYETKDYCPFSNIDYVYYYDTSNKKFNKIIIDDESTYKTIPKHSGLFIYNKHEDNLTIYYDKEEVLEKDKNIIDKEYINTLSNGWHLLGSSDSINDMSIFKDTKHLYIYDNVQKYTLLNSEDSNSSIKEYSGFWVHR